MPNGNGEIDRQKLEEAFAEQGRWATGDVTIQEIANDNKALIRDLAGYDPSVTVPLLASLLTLPAYQSNCIRLEILVVLAMIHCRGRKKANIDEAVRWFSQIGKSKCVIGEDPAEDVFVSLVQDRDRDYRIIEGIWESAGFYTQCCIDIISRMPNEEFFDQIKKSFRSLFIISDIVCERAGLHRYQLGSEIRHDILSSNDIPEISTFISRVNISFSELEKYNISQVDIEPFIFNLEKLRDMAVMQIGFTDLHCSPLISYEDKYLTIGLPSALSIAARDYLIKKMIKNKLIKPFDTALEKYYVQTLHNTPLLGDPSRISFNWQKADDYKWSNFCYEIDEGYFISYYFIFPSIKIHNNGFRNVYEVDDDLAEALQGSINNVIDDFEKNEDFKGGFIFLITCGWGKAYSLAVADPGHPQWQILGMSAADLIRLSWLNDMSPVYLWRIQAGVETLYRAGVQILNPNGVLNIIGWIRSNAGRFVIDDHFPDDTTPFKKPLILALPSNHLREVRADAEQFNDHHCTVDNTGKVHKVRRALHNPFSTIESAQCIFGSVSDARNGRLTSVYEGKLRLWISLTAPNINEGDIEYQLWMMACEWLHRIGNILDNYASIVTKTHIIKVYIEFHDENMPNKAGDKPNFNDLFEKCTIHDINEPNAYRVIFGKGYLDGFRVAENIAERLFVRMLVQAFIKLLDIEQYDKKITSIETDIVQNDEARSFHAFYARKFTDYVRDTLPQNLVAIDPIDRTTAEIDLGLRIVHQNQGNKIRGRRACTKFLNKVVDTLISEILNELKTFDRILTLKRIVANCEKASAEESHWRQTSAAILGLHGHEPSTVDRYIEQMSNFSIARLTSRVLCEIALCVSPLKGGAYLADIDLARLLARMELVIRIGGLSDAIHYKVLASEITISPLGKILFRNDFGDFVVNPMLSQVIEDRFISDAPLQRNNYDDPIITAISSSDINDEFLRIWKCEMGFGLDEAINIIGALQDKGIEDHNAILLISQGEYISLVSSDEVSKTSAIKFLQQFSLEPRPKWDDPPTNFENKDIYPWRFDRRLSLLTRPILKVDSNDDPFLMITPGGLLESFNYVFYGAYSGNLEQSFFQSDLMKNKWWGKAREGHTFNTSVAKTLSELNWQVRENIKIPEILKRKMDCDFGDIDVLAWRSDIKMVLVIECKDLAPARNYSEIAALLSEYQGKLIKGKPDKLLRHLNRVSLLEQNQDALQDITGVQEPQIVSCLVCSGIVPMQYATIDALANTRVGNIEDILAKL